MLNKELLLQTLEHIKKHPEHWFQGSWREFFETEFVDVYDRHEISCGTAMCFAGWACELSGAQWEDPKDGDIILDGSLPRTVSETAQEILGLNSWQSDVLFDSTNTLGELEQIVADLVADA